MGVQPSRYLKLPPTSSALHIPTFQSGSSAAGMVVCKFRRQGSSHGDAAWPFSLHLPLLERTRLKRRGCCVRNNWLHRSKLFDSQVQSNFILSQTGVAKVNISACSQLQQPKPFRYTYSWPAVTVVLQTCQSHSCTVCFPIITDSC